MDKTEGTVERVGGYRVVRRLVSGSSSEILLATSEGLHGLEQTVVLKLLRPRRKRDAALEDLFAREAAAYARLNHPAIVRLLDFFTTNEQLVMVLEYIEGPSLGRLRGMLKTIGGQLTDAAGIHLATGIFEGLAAAHGATDDAGAPSPAIHRDVNPSNVLVRWDGEVKLVDFGVAMVTGADRDVSAGLIKGSYGYMAPEQVTDDLVTPRADVYAGAVILWEILAGRRAFIRGALPEADVRRQLAEPRIASLDVLRPDLDAHLRDAVHRALEPKGQKRTITAEEMISVLRSVVSVEDGRAALTGALASVRHEPQPVSSLAPSPPPPEASDQSETDKITHEVLLPTTKMVPTLGAVPSLPPRPASNPRLRAVGPAEVDTSPTRPMNRTLLMGEGARVEAGAQGSPAAKTPPLPPAALQPAFEAQKPDSPRKPLETLPMHATPAAPEAAPLAFAQTVLGAQPPALPSPAAPRENMPSAPPAPLALPPAAPPRLAPPPFAVAAQAAWRGDEPKRRSSAGVALGIGLAVLAAGAAGVVGYFVWNSMRSVAVAPTSPASADPSAAATTAAATTAVESVSSSPPSASSAPALDAPSASAPASVSAPAPASAPASASGPASASAVPSAAGPSDLPPGTGRVRTAGAVPGRRIFVDGRVLGQTPETVIVKCGVHTIRLASVGTSQRIDVPCGSEITVGDR